MTTPKLFSLPLNQWPEIDRHLWNVNQQNLLPLKDKTQRLVETDYGNFLWFLSCEQELDPLLAPASRLTLDRARRFADKLKVSGYLVRMINNKFWALKKALRAMEPRCDISFLDIQGRARDTPFRPRRVRSRRRLSEPKPRKDPLSLWPEIDRDLWESGLQPHSLLDGPSRKQLRPDSIVAIIRSYHHWLKFLDTQGRLQSVVRPSERIIRPDVRDYVSKMLQAKCSPETILGQMYRIRSAVTIMEPNANLRWLTWPNGQSLRSQLPKAERRRRPFIDSHILYKWGLQLTVDSSITQNIHFSQITMLRDGLIIALFSARAPRLTSMSRLRIGENLTWIGNTFRLNLEMEDLKAGDPLEYDLPESLAPAFAKYLAFRSQLPAAKDHKFLWITHYGSPVSREGIQCMVRCRSKQRFGFSFGPHRFRHNLGTSARVHDPDHPGIGPAILNNSGRIFDKHYDLSDVLRSAARFHKSLKKIREFTKLLAAREFRKQRRVRSIT